MELTALSLSAAAALLRAGEVSSVQLTEAALQRTAAADGKLHAFLHVDAAGAMLQARAADASFAGLIANSRALSLPIVDVGRGLVQAP